MSRSSGSGALTVTFSKNRSTGARSVDRSCHGVLKGRLGGKFRPAYALLRQFQMTAHLNVEAFDLFPQHHFGRLAQQAVVDAALEGSGAVLLLLGAHDIRRAAITCEQIGAILRIEKSAERLDAAHDQQQIVLVRQREDGVDQIMSAPCSRR